jgi:hypothetical protein
MVFCWSSGSSRIMWIVRQAAVSYSHEALRQDLLRVRVAWEGAQSSRDPAIYGYLTAAYGLVAWWTAEGREIDRARRTLRYSA